MAIDRILENLPQKAGRQHLEPNSEKPSGSERPAKTTPCRDRRNIRNRQRGSNLGQRPDAGQESRSTQEMDGRKTDRREAESEPRLEKPDGRHHADRCPSRVGSIERSHPPPIIAPGRDQTLDCRKGGTHCPGRRCHGDERKKKARRPTPTPASRDRCQRGNQPCGYHCPSPDRRFQQATEHRRIRDCSAKPVSRCGTESQPREHRGQHAKCRRNFMTEAEGEKTGPRRLQPKGGKSGEREQQMKPCKRSRA